MVEKEEGDDVEAVCSSTSRPMALIIRWRQMEGERETERNKERGGRRECAIAGIGTMPREKYVHIHIEKAEV